MEMKSYMLENNYTIFLETENCGTIRAKFPVGSPYENTTAAFTFKSAVYDLEFVSPSGFVRRLFEGSVTLSPEVTR